MLEELELLYKIKNTLLILTFAFASCEPLPRLEFDNVYDFNNLEVDEFTTLSVDWKWTHDSQLECNIEHYFNDISAIIVEDHQKKTITKVDIEPYHGSLTQTIMIPASSLTKIPGVIRFYAEIEKQGANVQFGDTLITISRPSFPLRWMGHTRYNQYFVNDDSLGLGFEITVPFNRPSYFPITLVAHRSDNKPIELKSSGTQFLREKIVFHTSFFDKEGHIFIQVFPDTSIFETSDFDYFPSHRFYTTNYGKFGLTNTYTNWKYDSFEEKELSTTLKTIRLYIMGYYEGIIPGNKLLVYTSLSPYGELTLDSTIEFPYVDDEFDTMDDNPLVFGHVDINLAEKTDETIFYRFQIVGYESGFDLSNPVSVGVSKNGASFLVKWQSL